MTYDRQDKTQNGRTIALYGRPSKDNYDRSLFTSMREKKPDRFPNKLLLINSNILPST